MAKKDKQVKTFHPFTHENLEIKNELLNLARNAKLQNKDNKLEDNLASVLIYSSIAEYLAENLLQNLTHFIKTSSYNNFAGILFLEKVSEREGHMTLGAMIKELEKFSFPDKKDILSCFNGVCSSRNRIFHDLAKSDIETVTKMLIVDLPIIQEKCEELITRINTIYAGLGKILLPPVQETQT